MGKLVWMMGSFGAGMALFGAVAALFSGGIGLAMGVDAAGPFSGRSFGGLFASALGFAGAFIARERLAVGAAMLVVSSVLGLVLLLWFYLAGAVLMLVAAGIAFLMRAEAEERR